MMITTHSTAKLCERNDDNMHHIYYWQIQKNWERKSKKIEKNREKKSKKYGHVRLLVRTNSRT